MLTFSDFLPYLSIVLSVCVIIGGLFAMRQGYSKTTGEIQERVIVALKSEVEILTSRVADLERRNAELNHVQTTIVSALDKKAIKVTIDGDMVTLTDRLGASSVRKRPTMPHKKTGAPEP